MIGPLEIAILAFVVLLVFSGFFIKRLPAFGRSAGKGARVGGQKAKELAGVVSKKTDGIDSKSIANSAGKGIREAKELKEAITGPLPDKSKSGTEPKAPTATQKKSEDAS